MRRQKRDMNNRAFQRGYQAGLERKSLEECPHAAESQRTFWLSGWREGRSDQWDGYTGVSGVHRAQQQ
jgi:ribosome modulation factor